MRPLISLKGGRSVENFIRGMYLRFQIQTATVAQISPPVGHKPNYLTQIRNFQTKAYGIPTATSLGNF